MNKTFTRKALLVATSFAAAMASSISSAEVSTLMVVRNSANNLYKATCVGGVCTGWTQISGQFASQPAVVWDERNKEFVLVGTSSIGTLWRSTFTADGAFNNNWTQLSGTADSPVGMGAKTARSWNAVNPGGDQLLTDQAADVVQNVRTISVTPDFTNGFYHCLATAEISINRSNTTGDNVVFFAIGATNTDAAKWNAIDLPPGTPAGLTSIPIAVNVWFSNSSTATRTYYLNAFWRGTNVASISARENTLPCEYKETN